MQQALAYNLYALNEGLYCFLSDLYNFNSGIVY
jgi:hypothetical protein